MIEAKVIKDRRLELRFPLNYLWILCRFAKMIKQTVLLVQNL